MSPISPVRLIPMICPACQTPIPARADERAWVCATCQTGYLLGVDGTLCPQEIFFSNTIKPGVRGKPFWVALGEVKISERSTYSGNRSSEASQYWSVARLFYIPAFETAIEDIVDTSMALLNSPVQVQPGPPVAFLAVTTPPEDLPALAEFIVYSMEARRSDNLKTLRFSLRLDKPQLWII